MAEQQNNFLGIPIEGEIIHRSNNSEQNSAEELLEILQKLHQDPRVISVGWQQFTPYFNDGELCEFSLYSIAFRLVGLEEFEDHNVYFSEDDTGWIARETLLRANRRHWLEDQDADLLDSIVGVKGSYWKQGKTEEVPYSGPDEAFFDLLKESTELLNAGSFNDAVLAAFGDHATVTTKKNEQGELSGFNIEFYEHE